MFGSMIYFNERKIEEYSYIIKGKPIASIQNIKLNNEKGVNVKTPFIGGNLKTTTSFESTVHNNQLHDCNEFEKGLQGRDDFFDFIESPDYVLETISRGCIIKFESNVTIPEEFDMMQAIQQLKPYIFGDISKDMEENEREAFNNFFRMSELKIPIVCEANGILASGKIESKYLCLDYCDLEDLENEECVILAKLVTNGYTDSKIEIFEPLKDLLTLNRNIRRNFMNERPKELDKIFIDEKYIKLEILAIYQ